MLSAGLNVVLISVWCLRSKLEAEPMHEYLTKIKHLLKPVTKLNKNKLNNSYNLQNNFGIIKASVT